MTLNELKERIEEIESVSPDYEYAHILEDKLRHEVLEEVAKGSDISMELARLALATSNIKFPRITS